MSAGAAPQLRVIPGTDLGAVEASVLVLLGTAGAHLGPHAAKLDKALGGAIGTEFSGAFGETVSVFTMGRVKAHKVALVGLGEGSALDSVRLRNAMQMAFRTLLAARIKRLAVAWDGPPAARVKPVDVAQAAVEAAVLAEFTQGSHKLNGKTRTAVEELTLTGFPALSQTALARSLVMARATNVARELVNLPGGELTPPQLAVRAQDMALTAGLECEVLGDDDLRRLGYSAILAVAQGSYQPAQLVVLHYRPRPAGAGARPTPARTGSSSRRAPVLALVGKSITFDSGGISLKPHEDMHYMKGDMGGGAAVFGAMQAIAELKPDIEVIGVLAAAENMPSGRSMRPGDVIRTAAGKSVEVISTDAEGRLVLADGIHHAVSLGASHIVDIATLTGAQRVTLGPVAGLLLASDERLAGLVLEAADAAGERLWRMPAFPEYESMLESPIADLDNSPGGGAGAITAGLFLREFTQGRPWAHLDIAAPSWNRVPKVKQIPQGPSGFGVRTLAHLALRLGRQAAPTRSRPA